MAFFPQDFRMNIKGVLIGLDNKLVVICEIK